MGIHIVPDTDSDGRVITNNNPFASKKIAGGSLFKRVHGAESPSIPANTVGYIVLSIPYALCKFSGAEILNTEIGDKVDFLVLDTPTNTISGLPVETYGANFPVNQFGFGVFMTDKVDHYKNTSNYDADLMESMEIMCIYYNNSASAKKVYMNVELHEVKI